MSCNFSINLNFSHNMCVFFRRLFSVKIALKFFTSRSLIPHFGHGLICVSTSSVRWFVWITITWILATFSCFYLCYSRVGGVLIANPIMVLTTPAHWAGLHICHTCVVNFLVKRARYTVFPNNCSALYYYHLTLI